MKLNFKFSAFALLAMLCFSFACAPSSNAAASVPNMEKTTILIVDTPQIGLSQAISALAAESHSLVIVNTSHTAPDDAIIQASIAPDISRLAVRLPEVFPNQEPPKQIASYVSRNIPNTIKPPENRFNRAKPGIVRLC